PLPEGLVQAQVNTSLQNALRGFGNDQDKFAEALEQQGSSLAVFDANARNAAKKTLKTQLLLDALADDLKIQVGQEELTERLVVTSRQYGVEPQQLLSYLHQHNQLPAVFADVRRSATTAAVVEAATVTDTAGNTIDTHEFFGARRTVEVPEASPAEAAEEAGEADQGEESDEAVADTL
ncbi:MAG: trigger factor, partial [Mycobacteriaceae bacterium]|nr:trigger factor [Mycobacteriaceae bacterium]